MFSTLRQALYLLSTNRDSRLNHLVMMNVYKDKTDALRLVNVAYNVTGKKGYVPRFFLEGGISSNGIPDKVTLFLKSTQTVGHRKQRNPWA